MTKGEDDMPKTKEQKGAVIDKLTSELKGTEFGVLTDFQGLSMSGRLPEEGSGAGSEVHCGKIILV